MVRDILMRKTKSIRPEKFYDNMAPYYDDFIKETRLPSCSLEAEKVFLESVLGDAERIIDLGCGTGRSMKLLADGKRELTGVDLSPGMIALAKTQGLNALQASAFRLPFPDGAFDAAYSLHMGFGYCRTHGQMTNLANEIYRVLRTGGRVLLDSPHALKKGRRFTPSSCSSPPFVVFVSSFTGP